MLGAIAGDIVGSYYEMTKGAEKGFDLFRIASKDTSKGCRFTDDSVCTMAIMNALITDMDFEKNLRDFAARYPNRGYGGGFQAWLKTPIGTKNDSWANGAVMRVSPVGWFANNIDEALDLAEQQARTSHNTDLAVKGAQAVALTMYLARKGKTKEAIRNELNNRFMFQIVDGTQLSVMAWRSAQICIEAALQATSWEQAVRYLVCRGGDTDTFACISGGICETLYGLPVEIANQAIKFLPEEFLTIITEFSRRINW